MDTHARDLIQGSIRNFGLRYVLEMVAESAKEESEGVEEPEDAKDLYEMAREIKALAERCYV